MTIGFARLAPRSARSRRRRTRRRGADVPATAVAFAFACEREPLRSAQSETLGVSGRTYLVGERGPELFTPSRSGQIVPSTVTVGHDGVAMPTQVVLDGKVLAEAVHRVALKKKSTR